MLLYHTKYNNSQKIHKITVANITKIYPRILKSYTIIIIHFPI